MTTLCNHYPSDLDSDALKAKICDKKAIQTCESQQHQENPELKQGDPSQLVVCLNTFKIMCNRSTEGKCMEKYCNQNKYDLTVNLSSRMIWCYSCDMDSASIMTFYQNDNEDYYEKEEYKNYDSFVSKVITAIRESEGEIPTGDEQGAHSRVEDPGRMEEEHGG